MVRIGDFSLELCGGTHVRSTGEIGAFDLLSESGIAAGVRRSEALTGAGAERVAYQRRQLLTTLGTRLNAAPEELADKIEVLLGRNRQLERSLDELRRSGGGARDERSIEWSVRSGRGHGRGAAYPSKGCAQPAGHGRRAA